MRHFPIRSGPIVIPKGVHFGPMTLTFHGECSLTITDPDGHTFFEAGNPGAPASAQATINLDLSALNTAPPGSWNAVVTGNVQGTLTTTD